MKIRTHKVPATDTEDTVIRAVSSDGRRIEKPYDQASLDPHRAVAEELAGGPVAVTKERATGYDYRVLESDAQQPLYDGTDWATHHVALWAANDRPVYEWLRRHMAVTDIEWMCVAVLRALVTDLLYGQAGIGQDKQAARNVRESFTRADFDKIDWARVRADLIAE